jgi:hypothetical protein
MRAKPDPHDGLERQTSLTPTKPLDDLMFTEIDSAADPAQK